MISSHKLYSKPGLENLGDKDILTKKKKKKDLFCYGKKEESDC